MFGCFGCFGCVNRLSILAIMFFGLGTAVMMAAIVLSTGGLGGSDVVDLPRQSQNEAQGISPNNEVITAKVNDVVEKRKLFENVPLPSEISTEMPVVVTNFSLAVIFAILFGVLGTMLNNLIRDKEGELQAWMSYLYLDRLFLPLRAARFLADQDVQRGCLSAPVIIFIFAAYGLVFALLEPGINLLTPAGMQLAIILALSVGLISLAGDVAQRRVAWFWHRTSRFGVYPANLSVAAITTLFSRLIGLSPGILFGVPGGVDVDKGDEEPRFRDAILALTTLAVVAVFGILGWGIIALSRRVGEQTLSGEQLEFSAPLVQLSLALGLSLFVVAMETAFFEMVPLQWTMGSQIFRWNPLVWVLGFIPVTFAFAHTLLNPNGEYLDAFEHTPVLVLTIVTVVLTLLLVGIWAFFYFFEPPRPPMRNPVGQYPYPPQQGYSQQPPYPPQNPYGGVYPPQQPPPQGYQQGQYPPQNPYGGAYPPQQPPSQGQYPPPASDGPPPPQRRQPPSR